MSSTASNRRGANLPNLHETSKFVPNDVLLRPNVVSQTLDQYQRHEMILEAFLANSWTLPLATAIEEVISKILKAQLVVYWQDIPSLHVLYSRKRAQVIPHSTGLIGFTFFSREVLKAKNGAAHPSYSHEADAKICGDGVPVMLFPLDDSHGDVCGVVEVIRDPKKPFFDLEDEAFVRFFIQKFRIYSRWLFQLRRDDSVVLELMQVMDLEQFLILFQRRMCALFKCTTCELWRWSQGERTAVQYCRSATTVEMRFAGIVGEAITRECPINCAVSRMQSSYCKDTDGHTDESVLVVPLVNVKQSAKYAVVLRGSTELPVFTCEDEQRLRELAPYLVMALDNNERTTREKMKNLADNADRQLVLLLREINREFANGENLNIVVQTAMEALEVLVNAERSMLFLHDAERGVMRSMVTTGFRNQQLTLPVGRGILGRTWIESKVYSLADAFQDYHFDSTFDLETGYRTSTLVSVPVLDSRNKAIGVAQFLNKKDGKPFSTSDVGYIQVVAMVVGSMIDNSKLFATSTKATTQLAALRRSCDMVASGEQVKAILSSVLDDCKASLDCDRASIFMFDEVVNTLSTYVSDEVQMPPTIPVTHGIGANTIIQFKRLAVEKIGLAGARSAAIQIVNDALHDPAFNRMIDYQTRYKTRSVCAVPIISAKAHIFGVVEVVNTRAPDGFVADDGAMLTTFANLASVVIENQRLTDLAGNGEAQTEMEKWIGEPEFETCDMPIRFALQPRKLEEIRTREFDSFQWNGIGLFKVCFNLFHSFSLLQRFQVHNHLFFTFLYRTRARYRDHPFHNWMHAVDALQFTAYQLQRCQFLDTLTGVELYAVFVASLLQDINHSAYDNKYLMASAEPYGILFKDIGSCNEYCHCTALIDVVSDPRANIFHAVQGADQKLLWNCLTKLILTTDPAVHGKLLHSVNEVLDNGPMNLRNPVHRLHALKLIIKVSDVACMCRTLDLAQQWWRLQLEECWKQGQDEVYQDMPYSSPLNDRVMHSNDSGIVFMENHCIPLMVLVSRIFPELEETVILQRAFIVKWKDEIKRSSSASISAVKSQT